MVLLLLATLITAQGVAFALFSWERIEAAREAYRESVVLRTVGLVRLLGDTPNPLHDRVAQAASSRRLHFRIDDRSSVRRLRLPESPLAMELANALGLAADKVRVAVSTGPFRHLHADEDETREDDGRERFWHHRHGDWGPKGRWRGHGFAMAIQMSDGRWLNAISGWPAGAPRWGWRFLASLLLSAAAVAVVAVLVARRVARPMGRLAGAADRLGRGEAVETLTEEGPEEARRTIRAFNTMRERLDRFLRDRTAMLAAVSHDLRTPITSLRLRAEFIEDAETRTRILETLDEMQHMTEAALAFIREDVETEETRVVDISALADSVVADFADLGREARFRQGETVTLACRPAALRRALCNLVENALSHGSRAEGGVEQVEDSIFITVDDDGPGIPADQRERVFEPFVRLEESRSRETGGVGLGLAIARSIARAHGGDVTLENREGGGLRAALALPADAAGI